MKLRKDSNYILEDELIFLQYLGKRVWYTIQPVSNRYKLLSIYLNLFDWKKTNFSNYEKEIVISFIKKEIELCQNCDRMSEMCVRCQG